MAAGTMSYTLPDEFFQRRVGLTTDESKRSRMSYCPRRWPMRSSIPRSTAPSTRPQAWRPARSVVWPTWRGCRSPHPTRSGRIPLPCATPPPCWRRGSGGVAHPHLFPHDRIAQVFAYTGGCGPLGSEYGHGLLAQRLSQRRHRTGPDALWRVHRGGGLYLGLIALGATYMPVSLGPGVTDKVMAHLRGRQIYAARSPSTICCGPTPCCWAVPPRLQEMLDEYGVHADELSLSKVSCGAEPSSEAVRMRIAERYGIWPRDNYGLGEFYGPGVAGECEVGGGLHVLSDSFIAEVLDPTTARRRRPARWGSWC